jgi:HAD superfamily hydrolase (TIGR01484 family)
MVEKRSISSNENLASQSSKMDNDPTQSIYRFTKKLLLDQSQPHEQDSISRASGLEDQRTETEKARDLLHKNIKSAKDIIKELGDKLDEQTKNRYGNILSYLEKRAKWDPCEDHKVLEEISKEIQSTLKIQNIKAIQDLVKDPVPDNPVKRPSDQKKNLKFESSGKWLDKAREAVSKEWVHPDKAAEHLVKEIKKALEEGKKIGLMFDVDYTLLDPRKVKFGTNDWKIPQEWLEAVKKLQQHGIKIAINTGRNTKEIDQAFENAGAMELGNSLYLFGEDSNVYKKPGEGWTLIYPEGEKHVGQIEDISNKIKDKIKKNEMLTKLSIDADNIILHRTIEIIVPQWLIWINLGKNFEDNKTEVFNQLSSIAKKVVDEYPDFIMDSSENNGLEICPKGIRKAHKGNGTETFIRENGLSKFLAFGDDKPDVAMVRKAHLLVEVNKFIKDNGTLAHDERIRSAFIQNLKGRYHLTEEHQEVLDKTIKTKDVLNKKFQEKLYSSIPKTQLEDYSLIAVKHPLDMNKGKTLQDAYRQEQAANIVHDAAAITVGGMKALQVILENLVNKLDK